MDIAWSLVVSAFVSLVWGSYEMSIRASKKRIVKQIAFTKHRITEGRDAEINIRKAARWIFEFLGDDIATADFTRVRFGTDLHLDRVEELINKSILLLNQVQDIRDQIERETKYLKELEQQLDALQNREYTGKPI